MSASANYASATFAIYISGAELERLLQRHTIEVPLSLNRGGRVICYPMVVLSFEDVSALAPIHRAYLKSVAEAKTVIPPRPKGKPGRPKTRKE